MFDLRILIILVMIGLAVFIVVTLWTERQKTSATTEVKKAQTYSSIRAGSGSTFVWFFIGVGLSIIAGLVITYLVYALLGFIFTSGNMVVQLVRVAIGAILGFLVGYYLVFLPGRRSKNPTPENPYVTIKPGEKGYFTFMGIPGVPFGNLGPGWLWRIRRFMDYEIVVSAAHEDVSDGVEEYLTENGTELFVESGVTVQVDNALLEKGILLGGNIDKYISARRKAAIRRFVGTRRIPMDLAFIENPNPEQQLKLFQELVQIKGDVSKNGPLEVCDLMNSEISAYGLRVTQVQFAKVLFSDTLEKKIERTFDEIAEGPGLQKDMLNKAAQIHTIISKTLEHLGLKLEDLSPEQKFDLLKRAQAYVLAAEGQGGYQYHDFGQTPPSRVFVNANTNQPPPKGDGK
jgi:hypothetical protein